MKKKLLFSLFFMILFLIVSLQVVIAGDYYCFIFEWFAPGDVVYRTIEHATSSFPSHSIPDTDGYSPYKCDIEGQYKIRVTHYYYPAYQMDKPCSTYGGSVLINTHYVDRDLHRDDCDCYSGGDGAVCSFGESICWTSSNPTETSGNHCCGDDSATVDTYEDPGNGRACCYRGLALPHKSVGDGITIPNDLFCYDGKFYSCNHYYDFASYNTGGCYQIGGYYCMPSPGNKWTAGTGEGVSCGDCRECQAGECKDLCVPCQACSAGTTCVWSVLGTEDLRCGINGTIDCSGWYSATGRKGPDDDDVQQCWSYADITSAQCKLGGCKEANTSDCETWSYSANLKYECGECQYIQNGDCFSNSLGSCTNYITDTPCRMGGYYGKCDGTGTCNVITECADGTPVASCSADQPKYCSIYGDLYDDCSTCGCSGNLTCLISGSCIDPDFNCSGLSVGECDANAPTCFWDGTACSSCTQITSCASYTHSKDVCEADMCRITRVSSNCSWDGVRCYEYILTEDCSNGVDDDGDWLADCADPDCFSSAYCSGSVSCGDGIINSGEECDKGLEEGEYIFPYGLDSCTDFDYGGGTLACNPPGSPGECKFDFSDCTNATSPTNCSNSIIDSGESCDGANFVGDVASCSDLGFLSGSLDCLNCHFDTSNCVGAVTQESNPEACADGDDNDDDDYIDYEDADCQSRDPTITRTGGSCDGNKTATATLEYIYHLRFGLDDVIITKDVEITCPIAISAIVPFFSLLSFLIVAALLFVYYLLREKKFIKA